MTYRNQGYDFTITSSTAFDHKWIPERNIYDTISVVVDEIFDNYLSRPDVRQPILTQYCDGRQVTCPNWMTRLKKRMHPREALISRQLGGVVVEHVDVHGSFVEYDFFDDAFQGVAFLWDGVIGGEQDIIGGLEAV